MFTERRLATWCGRDSLRVSTDLNDWHEDIDNVAAAVVLERRSRAVGIRTLRKALRSRAYLLVDARRLTLQADAGVPPTRECAQLGADRSRVVTWTQHRAHAVRR